MHDFLLSACGSTARAAFVSLRGTTIEAWRRWQWDRELSRRWALEAAGTALYWGLQGKNTSIRCDSGRGRDRCSVLVGADGSIRGNAGVLEFGREVSATFGSADDIGLGSSTDGVGRRVVRKEGGRRSESALLCPRGVEEGWERYFELSEQVRTLCLLDAAEVREGAFAAAGLVVQPLPEGGKAPRRGAAADPAALRNAWRSLREEAGSRRTVCGAGVEAGTEAGGARALLRGVIEGMLGDPSAVVMEVRPLRFHCGCSENDAALRQLVPLLSMHMGDLEAWELQSGKANTLTCVYCNSNRAFTLDEVHRMTAEARDDAAPGGPPSAPLPAAGPVPPATAA